MRKTTSPREEWRGIPGHETQYEVSDHGHIRSLERRVPRGDGTLLVHGRPIRTPKKSSGYQHFKLADGDASTYPMVHQCVMAAFVGPCPVGHNINHRDGDKTNNHLSNLEYLTVADNVRHAFDHGLCPVGADTPQAKLTADQVRAIRAARGRITAKALGARYGVSYQYIPLIWARKRWARLPD